MSQQQGPTIYPAPEKCIYCYEYKPPMTDEHIIPLSLNGPYIFRNASCEDCRKKTHEFETQVINELFREFRIRYGARTRKPKNRPKTLWLRTKQGKVEVAANEFPAAAMFFKLGKANYMLRRPPFDPTFEWIPSVIFDSEEGDAVIAKHGWEDVTYQFKLVVYDFVRMIAKIAHGYAVAELGLDAFKPMVVDLILGHATNYGYLVGGSMTIEPSVPDKGNHWIALGMGAGTISPPVVLVTVRLFQQAQTPSYHVVVGRLETEEQIERMKQYLTGDRVINGRHAGL
jgi:hypothetical protein